MTPSQVRWARAKICRECKGTCVCQRCQQGVVVAQFRGTSCFWCKDTKECGQCPPFAQINAACKSCGDSRLCDQCTEGADFVGRQCGLCKGSGACQRCHPPKEAPPSPPKSAWAHLTEDDE